MKKTVIKVNKKINGKAMEVIEELERDMKRESRLAAIQALIPQALKAVEAELQEEIMELVGERSGRNGDVKRWGSNPGSVFLGDQTAFQLSLKNTHKITTPQLDLGPHEPFPPTWRMADKWRAS